MLDLLVDNDKVLRSACYTYCAEEIFRSHWWLLANEHFAWTLGAKSSNPGKKKGGYSGSADVTDACLVEA